MTTIVNDADENNDSLEDTSKIEDNNDTEIANKGGNNGDDNDDDEDKNDEYLQLVNFQSIRTSDGLETAIKVQWTTPIPHPTRENENAIMPDTKIEGSNNRQSSPPALHISTVLPPDELAPLFAGAEWAGTRLWHAAIAMIQYIVMNHDKIFGAGGTPTALLELGCGLGVPGMMLHQLFKIPTVLTDQPSLISQLQYNLNQNFESDASGNDDNNKNNCIIARELDWSQPGALRDLLLESSTTSNEHNVLNFKVVINCDCIYEPLYGESWKDLAKVLLEALEMDPNTTVLTSVERRAADGIDKFLAQLDASPLTSQTTLVWRDVQHKIEIYQTFGVTRTTG